MADRRYPSHPIPGVGAVVVGPKGILMATRDKDPGKGMWSIPGGGVEIGESQESAIIREIKEETGIDAEVLRFIDSADVILKDDLGEVEYHFLVEGSGSVTVKLDCVKGGKDSKTITLK